MISEKLREIFERAQRVCVLTGAGISAESGVPTFRGGGQSAVWKGMPFDEISSARMVRENLPEVWEWFDYRRGVLKDCAPNPAHYALAGWPDRFAEFTLVTQNIDGLHAAAGSRAVVELHGNIHRAYCNVCGKRFDIRGKIPHSPDDCDECAGKLRPDVVLFGEMLPAGAFERAGRSARSCELFFVVGTSALVYPAAGLAEIAKRSGAVLVEVNPEATPMTDFCDFTIREKAGLALPALTI
ncbi:MAG: NAD-dependent deacylase [Acidobacteria bacterium]|nr:NAD-dependent deacylase [Acidobacteriota bacterium]